MVFECHNALPLKAFPKEGARLELQHVNRDVSWLLALGQNDEVGRVPLS